MEKKTKIFHLGRDGTLHEHQEDCATFISNNLDPKVEAEACELDVRFARLAGKFRRIVNMYGIIQDVGLLFLDNDLSYQMAKSNRVSFRHRLNINSDSFSDMQLGTSDADEGDFDASGYESPLEIRKRRWKVMIETLEKLACFSLFLVANFATVYIFSAHIRREIWQFEGKMSSGFIANLTDANGNDVANITNQQEVITSESNAQTATGWSVLRNFLENFRRHVLRLFAFFMAILWLKSWHHFEMLFVDCRRYYFAFHTSMALNVGDLPSEQVLSDQITLGLKDGTKATKIATPLALSNSMRRLELRARQSKLLSENRDFYRLVMRRVNFALWFPIIQIMLNISAICLFKSSSRRRYGNWSSPAELDCVLVDESLDLCKLYENNNQNHGVNFLPEGSALVNTTLGSLIQLAMENFDSFHLLLHTSFHSLDHRVSRVNGRGISGGKVNMGNQSYPSNNYTGQNLVTVLDSALYCLCELFIYSMYVHGSRVAAATCLSIVLNIHHRCLCSFNNQLMSHIKRSKNKPMRDGNLVSLLKQYDMISMMHEKIERTFRWSVILWFMLMFINCLMQIFSFTESTSAHVMIFDSAPGGSGNEAQASQQHQQHPGQVVGLKATSTLVSAPTSPLTMLFLRIASTVFVCYAPLMIFYEAFKIESASNRAEQLVMLLARRQDDALAQSIEPTIFEPLILNIGGYFELNKRSVSTFLGAIVTFSVMFIELRTKSLLTNSNQAVAVAKRIVANSNATAIKT